MYLGIYICELDFPPAQEGWWIEARFLRDKEGISRRKLSNEDGTTCLFFPYVDDPMLTGRCERNGD